MEFMVQIYDRKYVGILRIIGTSSNPNEKVEGIVKPPKENYLTTFTITEDNETPCQFSILGIIPERFNNKNVKYTESKIRENSSSTITRSIIPRGNNGNGLGQFVVKVTTDSNLDSLV